MHTARWDHSQDLRGRRVAVIGTGASAVQVIPSIAPAVEKLVVLQRTPIWCLPKPDARLGPAGAAAARTPPRRPGRGACPQPGLRRGQLPPAGALPRRRAAGQRGGTARAPAPAPPGPRPGGARQADPALRARLQAAELLQPVPADLQPAQRRARDGLDRDDHADAAIRTVDGSEHEIDVLVLATGFQVFESGNLPPFPVHGGDGVELAQWWDANRFQAYEGVSVPGFPNMFLILGPYGFNGASYFTLIENQARHIVRCLRRARQTGATAVEVSREANQRYFETMLSRRGRQVFFTNNCAGANSYYFDSRGDAPFRSATTLEVAWHSAHFDLDDYRFSPLPA